MQYADHTLTEQSDGKVLIMKNVPTALPVVRDNMADATEFVDIWTMSPGDFKRKHGYSLGSDEINHDRCGPEDHDRSLPDDGSRLFEDWKDENGFASDKQVRHADGLLGCNACGQKLAYCVNVEWYVHVGADAYGCALAFDWVPA